MHTTDKPRPSEDCTVIKQDSEDSESDVSMLLEDTPLNIINFLAKHCQEYLSVD